MLTKDFIALTNDEKRTALNQMHPFDIAKLIEECEAKDKIDVLLLIKPDLRTETLSFLSEEDAAEILEQLPLKEQVDIIENLEPDDATDILLQLDEDVKEQILEHIDDDSKDDINSLIQYNDEETGSKMNTSILVFFEDEDVKNVTKKVMREAPEIENISYVYVVSKKNIFLGVVSIKELLRSKTPCQIGMIKEDRHTAIDTDPLYNSSKAMKDYNLSEMPIVNHNNHLLGVLTIDDAIDTYQEEAIEDFQKLSALPSSTDKKNIFLKALHRLPWLIVLLVCSLPIAAVTSNFEEVLAKVVLLMLFTPLILDASGDVATQTLAITLKTLTNNSNKLFKVTGKEILTGIINGLFMGIIAFSAALVFTYLSPNLAVHRILLSLVIGLSLWISVAVAPLLGFIIPYFFHKIKVDASVASGPFITTLIDILSLLIYLGIATLFMGVM